MLVLYGLLKWISDLEKKVIISWKNRSLECW